MNIEEEIAQGVANSFYAMEAGHIPTEPWEMPTPSSGDMQIAVDLMPLVKRAVAEAEARALRNFRASLIRDQMIRYGIVLPDVDDIVEALDEQADRIESEVSGV